MKTTSYTYFATHFTVTIAVSAVIACGGSNRMDRPSTSTGVANATTMEKVVTTNAILGTWRGTSLCTPVRPGCHDEIAVYHLASSRTPDLIAMTMNKVVDGNEIEMGGTIDYHVDYGRQTLIYEMAARDGTKGVFRFTWSGNHMTGTLTQLPGGEVVRNIVLTKD